MFDIHPLKFFNLVIVHTLDFWYMIKNKEATDSAALEFCHILNKIPPLRCRLLIYFLSYTQNLQLAITKLKISL